MWQLRGQSAQRTYVFSSVANMGFSKCFRMGGEDGRDRLRCAVRGAAKPFADIVSANHWILYKALRKSYILHRRKNIIPLSRLLIYVADMNIIK